MTGMRRLSSEVVSREQVPAGGASGNPLERVRLRDGSELLCKRVSPEWDWLSRATGDTGRALTMWRAGLFERMPRRVDHATVAVEPTEDGVGWDVYMRDVSSALVKDGERLDRARVRTLLSAVTEVHRAFLAQPIPELCSLEDRYHLLSPQTARRERERGNPTGDALDRCWEAFDDLVPADVAEPVLALTEDPGPLAEQLRAREQTLIHGDVRLSNLGVGEGGIVLIDWGERTGAAPAAVELASFLVFDACRLDVGRDEVLADYREIAGDLYDELALQLALIGGMVQLGCHCVLDLVLTGSEAARAHAVAELAWWTAQMRTAFETWCPT